MAFPEPDRFTIEAVAKRWDKLPSEVEEMVRTRKFKYIIVKGEIIGDSPLTRHLYFEQDLWLKVYGEKVAIDPVSRDKEYEKDLKKHQAAWDKAYGARAKSEPARLKKKHGGQAKFNPAGLKKGYDESLCKTFYSIGPNEVANLWQPFTDSKEWNRPQGEVVIYIPRAALEAFEVEHNISSYSDQTPALKEEKAVQVSLKKKKGIQVLAPIKPDHPYPINLAAPHMHMEPKHLSNNIRKFIETGKLKAFQDKTGHWFIFGREIDNWNSSGS